MMFCSLPTQPVQTTPHIRGAVRLPRRGRLDHTERLHGVDNSPGQNYSHEAIASTFAGDMVRPHEVARHKDTPIRQADPRHIVIHSNADIRCGVLRLSHVVHRIRHRQHLHATDGPHRARHHSDGVVLVRPGSLREPTGEQIVQQREVRRQRTHAHEDGSQG